MAKDWETIEVDADMLKEISESYSGDTIAESKIRKPFKFQGSLFVSVGGFSGGGSTPEEECYHIVPRQEFKGKATLYGERLNGDIEDWAEERRAQAKGFYDGMLIKRGKSEWVLVEQLALF